MLFFLIFFLVKASAGQKYSFEHYEDLIHNAGMIAEGRISSSESFWDSQHRNIYTRYHLEVENVLKGSPANQIDILVKGGKVDQTWQMLLPSVEFQIGDEGIFLLDIIQSNHPIPGAGLQYTLSGGNQSYVLNSKQGDEWERIDGKEDPLLNALESVAGKSVEKYLPLNDLKSAADATVQVVDSIYPDVVTAGTGDVLSITGSGFGETRDSSKVWFVFSDRPEFIYSNEVFRYISWSDTLIELFVPFKAATGQVTVEVNHKKVNSSQTLKVRFASTNNSKTNNPVNLINTNQKGGYSWHLHSNLNTYDSAKDIVIQAMNEWICATSVPWSLAGDTQAEPGKDGISTVSFGTVTNSIDAMGLTSLFMTNHPVDGTDCWILDEVDIVLSNSNDWCFTGDCANSDKYDFKTVVMHQLAHALLIDHVNDPADLMYYSLEKGELRDIGPENIECAEYNLSKSAALNHPDYMTINPYQFEAPVIFRNVDSLSTTSVFSAYQWYDTDGPIPGATEAGYKATKTEEYHLEGTNEFGCIQVSEAVEVFIENNKATTEEILMYPNPMKDQLTIESAVPYNEAIFFNILGQKILHVELDPESTKTTFHMGGIPSGVYTVWLINADEKVRKKFVVQ